MKTHLVLPALVLLLSAFATQGQNYFRSGIFLHHSTGQNIWGPNGSSTSVPQEMDSYNTFHGYSGLQAVTMNEEWWSPSDNEWVTQHTFFEDPSPVTGIGYYLPGNKIIVIKSCFPSSAISDAGTPDDTLTPDLKTVANYKWHWRHIVKVMRAHPENFFAIWTNAPLEPYSTNAAEAALSKWFCTWAKDTLAQGLDLETGIFPDNVYVFDFFSKLTGANGMMLSMYAAGPGDSHPNAAATALVAPQFVQEIFDASIGYESIFGIVYDPGYRDTRLTAWPTLFEGETLICFSLTQDQPAELALFDMAGKRIRSLWTGSRKGEYSIRLAGSGIPSGLYCVRLSGGGNYQTIKVVHQ